MLFHNHVLADGSGLHQVFWNVSSVALGHSLCFNFCLPKFSRLPHLSLITNVGTLLQGDCQIIGKRFTSQSDYLLKVARTNQPPWRFWHQPPKTKQPWERKTQQRNVLGSALIHQFHCGNLFLFSHPGLASRQPPGELASPWNGKTK